MIKKFFLYLVGTVITKAMSIIMLPLYTSCFAPDAYGTIDVLVLTLGTVVSFSFLELWSSIFRFMFDINDADNIILQEQRVISNTIFLTILLTPLYILCLFVLFKIIPYEHWFIVSIMGVVILIHYYYQFFARGKGLDSKFIISGIITTVVEVSVNLILILGFHVGTVAVPISSICARLIAIGYLEYNVRLSRRINFKVIERGYIKTIVCYATPLAINAAAFWGLESASRIIAYSKLGAAEGGYLAVVSKFTAAIMLFVTVYSYASQDEAFACANGEDCGKIYSRMFKDFFLLISIGIGAVLVLAVLVFPFLIAPEYAFALRILPFSFIATFVSALSSLFGIFLAAKKNTRCVMTSTILGAICNIISLYLLLPIIGVYSVPCGLFIGFLVNTLMRAHYVKRETGLIFSWSVIAFGSIIVLLYSFVVFLSDSVIIDLALLLLSGVLFFSIFGKQIQNFCQGILGKLKR